MSLIPPEGGLTARGFRKVDSAEVIGTPAEIVIMRRDQHVFSYQSYIDYKVLGKFRMLLKPTIFLFFFTFRLKIIAFCEKGKES